MEPTRAVCCASAVLASFIVACTTPRADDTAPATEFSSGELAHKIGVETWVWSGDGANRELAGLGPSAAGGVGPKVVHAVFSTEPDGRQTLDFDLPEVWHGEVSASGVVLPAAPAPASVVDAVLSSRWDLQSMPRSGPTSLATTSVTEPLHPLLTRETPPEPLVKKSVDELILECTARLLPGVSSYADIANKLADAELWCDDNKGPTYERVLGVTTSTLTARGRACVCPAAFYAFCVNVNKGAPGTTYTPSPTTMQCVQNR
jgi:hypothetical protein